MPTNHQPTRIQRAGIFHRRRGSAVCQPRTRWRHRGYARRNEIDGCPRRVPLGLASTGRIETALPHEGPANEWQQYGRTKTEPARVEIRAQILADLADVVAISQSLHAVSNDALDAARNLVLAATQFAGIVAARSPCRSRICRSMPLCPNCHAAAGRAYRCDRCPERASQCSCAAPPAVIPGRRHGPKAQSPESKRSASIVLNR